MRDSPPPKDASGQCLIGVAWYSPLEWDSIPECVADPMTFQRPYHEWLANAEDTVSTLQKEGAHVVRFPFRLDDFLAWCEVHYRAPDAQARATYTAEKTKEMYGFCTG